MRKHDRELSQILHADLHWLDVADRARYKLAVITVHRCLDDKASNYKYLADCCVAVCDIASRQRLRSAHQLINAVHSTVAHFLSPDQLSGTRLQTTLKTVVLGSH